MFFYRKLTTSTSVSGGCLVRPGHTPGTTATWTAQAGDQKQLLTSELESAATKALAQQLPNCIC